MLSGGGSCCWWSCTYVDGQPRNHESAWRLQICQSTRACSFGQSPYTSALDTRGCYTSRPGLLATLHAAGMPSLNHMCCFDKVHQQGLLISSLTFMRAKPLQGYTATNQLLRSHYHIVSWQYSIFAVVFLYFEHGNIVDTAEPALSMQCRVMLLGAPSDSAKPPTF